MTRRVVALAGAGGLRLLLDPLPQRHHLGADRPRRQVDQRALVVGDALAHAVQAGVVGAALEHGVRRLRIQLPGDRLEQRGDVALDELVLEREGRRRDHDPVAVQQRRHEVAQRLAGAGASLHEQVASLGHRLLDGLGHRDLTGPLVAAELRHGGGEDLTDPRCVDTVLLGHPRTLCGRADGLRHVTQREARG